MASIVKMANPAQARSIGLMQNIFDLFTPQKKETTKTIVSWRSRYSVNIETIDDQHKKIFDLLNKYFDGIFKGASTSSAIGILEDIIQTSRDHFFHEEDLMQLYEYPGLYSHKQIHDYFINEMKDIQKHIETNAAPVSLGSGDYIRKWFVNHIMASDKPYSTFIRLRGIS